MTEPQFAYACDKGGHHVCSVVDCHCCANGHGLNNLGDPVPWRMPIEAEARRPCPQGCPGGHTEAEYYGGGCARRDQEAFEGWGPGR